MRIRIEHTSNPLNYGTNMMVANFMYYLNKETGNENIFILDVYNDEDLNTYKNQCPELNIERQTIDYNFYSSKNMFQRITNKIKREVFFCFFNKKNLKKLENSADILVILGGDDLSEYYGTESLKRELNRIKYIKSKMNVFLVGQTIGPFKQERKELVKNSLENTLIFSRENWTKNYLEKDIGLKNIVTSSDLALLPLPGEENRKTEVEVLNRYNLSANNYVTIIPSGLYESYCNDRRVYIDNIVDILDYIKCKTNFIIVLLPHVLGPKAIDDRNIIKSLEEIYGLDKRIMYIYDTMKPLEARFILGNSKFTITGRMHGAISTFQMRKPAISISYSVKYEGVIGRDLELKELIVEGDRTQLWINRNVANETIAKIKFVLNNYDSLIERIDKSVKRSEENIKKMINEIC